MFTKELIAGTIEYFKWKNSTVISEETAEEYLSSLADLFEAFTLLLMENN